MTKTPVAPEIIPVTRPTSGDAQRSCRDLEAAREQRIGAVGGEYQAKRDARPRGAARHQPDGRERADEDRDDHPGQAAREPPERRAGRHLPDVGADGRQHHQSRRLRRRHDDAQESHDDRRQADPDRAFDEAGDEEGDADEDG
jgi:hypothetical protein